MDYQLPYDVKEKIEKNTILRIITFFLLEVLVVAFIILTPGLLSNAPEYQYVLFCAVAVAIPVFICGIHKMIFDRTWSGKIIGVRIKNVPGRLRGSGGGVSYDWNDAICLTVRKSNGRIIEYNVEKFLKGYDPMVLNRKSSKVSDSFENYKAGDSVYHFFGTKGLVVYRPGETNNKFCVLCGTQQSEHNERCNDCGHTLIDPGYIYETKHSK